MLLVGNKSMFPTIILLLKNLIGFIATILERDKPETPKEEILLKGRLLKNKKIITQVASAFTQVTWFSASVSVLMVFFSHFSVTANFPLVSRHNHAKFGANPKKGY